LEEKQDKVVAFAKHNEELQKEKDIVERKLTQTLEALESATAQLASVNLSIDSLKAQIDRKTKDFSAIKQKLEELEVARRRFQAELVEEKFETKATENLIAKLNSQIDKLKLAMKQLKKQKDDAGELCSQLEKEIPELRIAVTMQKQETLKMQKERKQLMNRLSDFKKSGPLKNIFYW